VTARPIRWLAYFGGWTLYLDSTGQTGEMSHQSGLRTPLAREAAAAALKNPMQPLHGLGVDMSEGAPKVFGEGNVVCYEPGLIAGGQQYFVEDTILITRNGHEILNPALPYAPGDIERAMAR